MVRVPEGWLSKDIGDIADVTSGGTPSRKEPSYWNGSIPWVTTGSIDFNVIQNGDEFITPDGLANSSAKLFPVNTILMAMYGQGMTRGRVAILGIEATTNQACAAIMVQADVYYKYIYYYLASQYTRIREMGHGGNQKNLNNSLVKQIPISLPPLAEQKAIAQILGTWDEAIALTQALIDALTRRKRALMQILIPNEHSISDDWTLARLGDFITQDRDYIKEVESKLYPRISVKWWAKGAVVAGYDHGDDVKMKRHQLAKTGQIIVSEIWAKHGSIGIIPEDGEGALITSHFYLFDVLGKAKQYQEYIRELVNANYFMIQADRMSQGSTGYASIRANDFLRFKIPIPPVGEETTIAEILSICDELIAQYEMYLDKLQEQKRGLMQVLLTGQVRVGVD